MVARYLIALVAAAVGVLVRLAFLPLLGERFPFFVSFLLVLLIARYAGCGPALLSLCASAPAVTWLIIEPRYSLLIRDPDHRLGLALYLIVGAVAVAVIDTLHRSRRNLALQHERLEREAAARQAAELDRQRQEVRLFESEERLRAFMDNNPAMAWLKDHEGRYVLGSASFLAPFGLTQQDFIGRTDHELFSQRIADEYVRNDQSVLAGNRPAEFTELTEEPDGEHSHLVVKFPVRDARGRCYVGGVAIDITRQKSAEAQARAESERVQLVADAVPALIAYVDADFRYRLVNRSYESWFRRPRSEFVGCLMREALGDAAWERIGPYAAAALRGDVVTYEDEVPYRHGGRRWIHATYTPDIAQDGAVRGFVAHVVDITLQRRTAQQVRDSDNRFRRAADATRTLVYEVDLQSGDRRDDVAHTYGVEHIVGDEGRQPELNTRWWHARIHPDDLARHLADIKQCTDDPDCQTYRSTYRVRHTDSSWRYVEDTGQIVRDMGAPRRLVGTIQDVTATTLAQEQLREADRRKDEFLATLAHELRNPLTPVRASLELLQRADDDRQLRDEARSTMERQIALMVRLIDDLLDVNRITRNKLELRRENVELAAVIQHAVETCRPLCDKAGHQLVVSLPEERIVLHADAVRLGQVFGNLLSNACKYTPPGGRITLSARRSGAEVVVTVRDNGLGIPVAMLPKVFDLFTQVDRPQQHADGGLGIGLSLVRRLVELHEGSVVADSEGAGQGAEFTVRLPVASATPASTLPRQTRRAAATPPRRILVVDDNRDAARTLGLLLKLAGHELLTAHDGAAAVEQAAAGRPDVILLDIGLPKMDGYEACRSIRAEPWGAEIIIVALTGWGQAEDRRKSAAAGFDGHLVKPVEYGVLDRLLADLDAKRRHNAAALAASAIEDATAPALPDGHG